MFSSCIHHLNDSLILQNPLKTSATIKFNLTGSETNFKVEGVTAKGLYVFFPFSRQQGGIASTSFQRLRLVKEEGSLLKKEHGDLLGRCLDLLFPCVFPNRRGCISMQIYAAVCISMHQYASVCISMCKNMIFSTIILTALLASQSCPEFWFYEICACYFLISQHCGQFEKLSIKLRSV